MSDRLRGELHFHTRSPVTLGRWPDRVILTDGHRVALEKREYVPADLYDAMRGLIEDLARCDAILPSQRALAERARAILEDRPPNPPAPNVVSLGCRR